MVFKGWDRVSIKRDNGSLVEAIAPVIVSASRSTDIPGCFGDWFVHRLRTGYVVWKNPFNGQRQYVSFEKTRCIVFWTKNPKPFLKHIKTIQNMGIGVLFQVTVNDYESDGLELNIPSLQKRVASFRELSEIIGPEQVLWRFDPLILTDKITCAVLIEKVQKVGDLLHKFTNRLTISFLSNYAKVKNNLCKEGVCALECTEAKKHEIARGIALLNKKWGLSIVSCAEKNDLSMYGIPHGRCIDPDLILHCFGQDQIIQDLLSYTDKNDLFGNLKRQVKRMKDPGQRALCHCVVSKDVGMYNTCRHGCVYCYAHTSPVKTMCSDIRNYRGESIIELV